MRSEFNGVNSPQILTRRLSHVPLMLFAAIQIFPLIWLVLFSLKTNAEIFGGSFLGLPAAPQWGNYVQAITTANIGRYFFNSVVVTGATIILTGVLSAMAAYAIARMNWGLSNTVLIIFLSGLMIPLHAVLLPVFLQLRDLNLLDTYWALILPYTAFNLPFSIAILVGFLESIPRALEEAALIDGCNIYQVFFHIILPLTKPALVTASIFTLLACWNELMFANVYVTSTQYRTLTAGIANEVGQYVTNWGLIGAGLVIATLPTVLMYLFSSRQIEKNITAGAIKG